MFHAPEDENRLKNRYKTTVIVWLAITFSVLIHAGVGFFLFHIEDSGTRREFRFLLYVFSFVSILSPGFPKSLILSPRKISKAATAGASALARGIQIYRVIIFVFCESMAIYGLVLYILRGGEADFYILSGLSLTCFIVNYPKFEFWQDLYQRSPGLLGGLKLTHSIK